MTNADKYLYDFANYTEIKFDAMVRNGFVFDRNPFARPTQCIAPLHARKMDEKIAQLPMEHKMFLAAKYVIALVYELSTKYQYELMATDMLSAKGAVIYSAIKSGVPTDSLNDAFVRAGEHVLQNLKKYNNILQQQIANERKARVN